jgi:hypothetical protein
MWNKLRYPPTDEENTAHLYTGKYYSVIRKKEILSFAGKWMELKYVMSHNIARCKKTTISYSFLHVKSKGIKEELT